MIHTSLRVLQLSHMYILSEVEQAAGQRRLLKLPGFESCFLLSSIARRFEKHVFSWILQEHVSLPDSLGDKTHHGFCLQKDA